MQKKRGFTLLIAIVVTSLLLAISFVVANVAFKQLLISKANKESQYAFYAADSGVECAVYWDLKDGSFSAFATSTNGTISCNGQSISTGSESVPTVPSQSSVIGGGDVNPTSIFYLTLTKGCVIVEVTKFYSGGSLVTRINSKGYNTCSSSDPRRVERGITLTY